MKTAFYLLINDQYSKLVYTVPFKNIFSTVVAKFFVTNLLLLYGSVKWFLLGNDDQFTARLLQHVCKILRLENSFTAISHPQCNVQTDWCNCAMLQAFRSSVADNPTEQHSYFDFVSYAYKTQVYRATKCNTS